CLVCLLLLSTWAWGEESRFVEADRAFNRGDFGRAERLYQEGLDVDRARALEGLGAVYLSTGRDDDFRKAVAETAALRRNLPTPAAGAGPELVSEGGFERGLVPPWGTGHYESGNFSFGIWWNSLTCRSFAKMDGAVVRSGSASLRITNFTPAGPHLFGTSSQRIRAVTPNTLYEVSLWARADSLAPGAVQLILDAGWHVRPLTLPAGTYEWQPLKARFNSGDLPFIDLRILSQNTGTVWIDELSLRRLEEGEVAGDPILAADDLFRRGMVRQALERYRELEQRWASEPARLPGIWVRMAGVLAAMGEYGQAMALYEKVRGPRSYAVWMAVGDIYLNLGQPDQALEQFRHVHREATLDQALRAQAADRMALAFLRLGNLQEAVTYESESLGIMAHINDVHGRGAGLCHLGQIYLRTGDLGTARDCLEQALPLARATGDRKLESDVLTQRAIWKGQQNDVPGALQDLAEAVRLRRQVFDRYGLIFSLYWQGRFQARSGDRAAALASLKEAVELLESVKDGAGTIERGGETLLQSGSDLYEELIRLLLEQGNADEARQTLARSRSETLRRLFEKQGASLPERESRVIQRGRELAGEREAVERRLQEELSKAPDKQDPERVEVARRELDKRLIEYREFLRELFQTHPELAGLLSVHPKQLRQKQAGLSPDAAIVEYLCGQNQLYVFVATREALDVKIVDLGRQEVTRRVASLRRKLARPTEAPALMEESHRLYRDLLGPVESHLQGVRSLAVLPNGPLHYLPFQALVTDPARGEFLVDRMACVNLCEESFLAPPAGGAPRNILLLGNPDRSLSHAEEEVRLIAALFPGSSAYLRETARKDLLLTAAGRYQALHIASHGVLDNQDVARSYIVLAADPADAAAGRLTVREVWGLNLQGLELVTLSACQTALGEGNPGDDLISLENAFLFAGASSVVASLWKVDDEATGMLMAEFYRSLAASGRARALQAAQLAVKKRHPHPYYWAPFILVGPSE
ncbi:MAG: CHAT domain-containing protein, partial [Candidatus Eremiobacterota bacterium]